MSTPIFDALVREQPLPPGTLLEERMQNRPLEDEVYYPDITVPLVGGSRSAGAIIEKVAAALRHYLRDGIDGLEPDHPAVPCRGDERVLRRPAAHLHALGARRVSPRRIRML